MNTNKRPRRGRVIAISLAVTVLGVGLGSIQTIGVHFHRLRLENDFEYFFEIADSSTDSLEGRAIASFLEEPANRAAFTARVLDEALDSVELVVSTGPRFGQSDEKPRRLLDSAFLDEAGLVLVDEVWTFVFFSKDASGAIATVNAAGHRELQALRRWLGEWSLRVSLAVGLELDVESTDSAGRLRGALLGQQVSGGWDAKEPPVAIRLTPEPTRQRRRIVSLLSSADTTEKTSAALSILDADDVDASIHQKALEILNASADLPGTFTRLAPERLWRVVARIRLRLENGPTFERIEHQLIDLGRLRAVRGDERGEWLLSEMLRRSDGVARVAAETIETSRARFAVPQLVKNLSRDGSARGAALDALFVLVDAWDPVAMNGLRSALDSDPSPQTRQRAANALARIGPAAIAAIPDLVAALCDPEERVRTAAARAIHAIAPQSLAALHSRPLPPR